MINGKIQEKETELFAFQDYVIVGNPASCSKPTVLFWARSSSISNAGRL